MKFLKSFHRDWRILAIAGLLSFGFVSIVSYFQTPAKPASGEPPEAQAGVDTMIPAGFLLIPIEVQNYESLDSLLGNFGYVDLFVGDGKKGKLVARDVRILRAPQNPSHFAVLARESDAHQIVAQQGQFFVAIKSKAGAGGTQIVKEPLKSNRIHFDDGD